jgi:hypothetical protein
MYIKYTGKVFSFRALEGGQHATATIAVRKYFLPTATAHCKLSCQPPLPTADFLLNLEP